MLAPHHLHIVVQSLAAPVFPVLRDALKPKRTNILHSLHDLSELYYCLFHPQTLSTSRWNTFKNCATTEPHFYSVLLCHYCLGLHFSQQSIYLSDIWEVADLLLLPAETGRETHWSSMATCDLKHKTRVSVVEIYMFHCKHRPSCEYQLTDALTVCFFFSFFGSIWATTTSGHNEASNLMKRNSTYWFEWHTVQEA